jgi:preprotein translocase subunit Sec61beta
MVKFTKSAPQAAGPSSAIGIQRFFDSDQGGPELTPAMVFVATAVFIAAILALHMMF